MTNQDVFLHNWWIDISFQLVCSGLVHASNFDLSLLRTDIPNGIWLRNQLNRMYQEHAPTQRSTIGIYVLQPDFVLSQCFTLKLEVMVRRNAVTRFYTFPEPFSTVAPPPMTAPAPASTAQVPNSAAPAPGIPGPSSSGGDGVSGGSGAAVGSWMFGDGGGFGGGGVPGGSGGS